tara:strand:+ start:489 stop:1199 length:711 start_codon:yes stop_codon:yes gene_type:complete
MYNLFSFRLLAAFLIITFLSGCSAKLINPMPVNQDLLVNGQDKRIGIVTTSISQVDINYPGADCLLCLAAASAMNSTLSSYVETLDNKDIFDVKQDLADAIKGSGSSVIVIEQAIDLNSLPDFDDEKMYEAEKDFRQYGQENDLTHLLVVEVGYLGFLRKYASYIPTSSPFATFTGNAFMVDLATNTYQWYLPVDIVRQAEGEWDEPETFPGLTNAFYQTIEQAKAQIVSPLIVVN